MKNCIFYFNFDRKVKYERKSKHGIIKLRRLIPVFHNIVPWNTVLLERVHKRSDNSRRNVRSIIFVALYHSEISKGKSASGKNSSSLIL